MRTRTGWPVRVGLIAVTVVAISLRAPGLGVGELWSDDAWVALQHRAPLRVAVFMGSTAPGFNALQSLWLAAGVETSWWAQAPVFAVSAMTVPLAACLVRWAAGSWGAGLVTASVLASSPISITYATRVKQYPLDSALCLLLVCLGLRLLLSQRRQGRLPTRPLAVACYVGSGAVLISAATAPLVATSIGLPLLLALRQRETWPLPRPWLPLLVLVATGVTVALVVVRPLPENLHQFWDYLFPDWSAGPRSVIQSFGTATRDLLAGALPVAGIVGLVLVVVAAGVLLRTRPLVAVFLLTPVVAGYGFLAVGLAPLGGGRTDMWLYPPIAVLLGLAAQEAGDALGRRSTTWLVPTTAVLLLLGVSATSEQEYYPPSNVKDQIAYLDANRRPGDAVNVAALAVYTYATLTPDRLDFRVDRTEAAGFAVQARGGTRLLSPPGTSGTSVPPRTSAPRVWWLSAGPDPAEDVLASYGYTRSATPVPNLRLWVR